MCWISISDWGVVLSSWFALWCWRIRLTNGHNSRDSAPCTSPALSALICLYLQFGSHTSCLSAGACCWSTATWEHPRVKRHLFSFLTGGLVPSQCAQWEPFTFKSSRGWWTGCVLPDSWREAGFQQLRNNKPGGRCLAGSIGRANDSWSQDWEFKSHVGQEAYLKTKQKPPPPSPTKNP